MSKTYVECPICGSPDMHKITEEDVEHQSIIHCTNHACRSNGGNYDIKKELMKISIEDYDIRKWSTVLVFPSLWWKLKNLFKDKEIMFCQGQDHFIVGGVEKGSIMSVGGVPTDVDNTLKGRTFKLVR